MSTTPKFKKTHIATLCALLIGGAASDAFAQEAADMARVITTATRAPKAVDKIPGAITVISSEEINDSRTVTEDLTAVLTRTVPGFSEASQSMVTTSETLRGRTALFLFDGVPMSSPLRDTGRNNSTFTDLGIIERIEVINGPSASEGIGASGGIIHYLTATPKKNGTEAQLTAKYTTQFRDDDAGYKLGFTVKSKSDDYDVMMAASSLNRAMAYDADGRMLGLQVSGSSMDTEEKNLYLKVGFNFGKNNEQRITGSISQFDLRGLNNYSPLYAHTGPGTPTDSSIKGVIPGTLPQFNAFKQYTLQYQHADLLGGALNVLVYRASQRARFNTECGTTDCLPLKADLSNLNRGKQDPNIAPLGTLFDASELHSEKHGIRSSWNTDNLAGVTGLGLNAGLDLVYDTTEQRLALTNRLWVPPMQYSSTAPFAQLSYDAGPITLSGGLRRENGKLDVDTYTTVWANRPSSQNTCGPTTTPCLGGFLVKGGSVDYGDTLTNIGAVWRLPNGFSTFASYSKGFTLPNVGIPLRNVARDGVSVSTVADTEAIISDNKEIGVTWRGKGASMTGSVYRSYSQFGASLAVDPVTKDYIMVRQPVQITGLELSGEYALTSYLKVNGLYSKIRALTTINAASTDLNINQGITNVSPDKMVLSGTWKFNDQGSARLGATTLMDRDINVGTSKEEHTRGYTLFDLGVNYDLKKFGTLALGVENLTNKYYILSYSQIDSFQNYVAGRGRLFSLTYNTKF
jgi:iron complex outermembrane receptor protein